MGDTRSPPRPGRRPRGGMSGPARGDSTPGGPREAPAARADPGRGAGTEKGAPRSPPSRRPNTHPCRSSALGAKQVSAPSPSHATGALFPGRPSGGFATIGLPPTGPRGPGPWRAGALSPIVRRREADGDPFQMRKVLQELRVVPSGCGVKAARLPSRGGDLSWTPSLDRRGGGRGADPLGPHVRRERPGAERRGAGGLSAGRRAAGAAESSLPAGAGRAFPYRLP